MSSVLILDQPLPVVTTAIDPVLLAELNDAWMQNALLLGKICLAIGFIIGAIGMYVYMRRKYADTG